MKNRIFFYSLAASFFIHLLVIIFLSSHRGKLPREHLKPLEITYRLQDAGKLKRKKTQCKDLKIIKKSEFPKKVEMLSESLAFSSPLGKKLIEVPKNRDKFKLDKKYALRINPSDMKRSISIPLLKAEKITNPKYLDYNQNIRQRIKRRAYSYVNHPDFQKGEVYLTFVLSSDGALKRVKIIEDRTSANSYLKNIGLRSIKDSSPFPRFPDNLNYPELTFNVVISFKIKG